MARPALILLAALLLMPAAGCGFLDDDVLMSDEEFEASFGTGGLHAAGHGSGVGSVHGCGGYGLGHAYGSSHMHLGAMHFYAPSAHNAPFESTSGVPGKPPSQADPAHLVWHRDEHLDDQRDILPHGKLETWGDYLEASIAHAQRQNLSK